MSHLAEGRVRNRPRSYSNVVVRDEESRVEAASSGCSASLDRSVFCMTQFSAPIFVNNITNRVLFPMTMHASSETATGRQTTSKKETKSIGDEGKKGVDNDFGSGVAGDGSAAASDAAAEDPVATASCLTARIAATLREVEKMQQSERQDLQARELLCRRVETNEKRKLATIRLGLDATFARLHEYESRVYNALAATAGIEQHLAQSNARLMRARAVSLLLNHFRMLTSLEATELCGALKGLSRARAEQRSQVTAQWEAGDASLVNTTFYGEDNERKEGKESGRTRDAGDTDGSGDTSMSELLPSRDEDTHGQGCNSSKRTGKSKRVDPYTSQRRSKMRSRRQSLGNEVVSYGVREGLHRYEENAISVGLARTFAVRSCTELQVEWCQRLLQLRRELEGVVKNTNNIETYVEWLRQELASDVFHLVECFSSLYSKQGHKAARHPYGLAILRTVELISRLHATITSSHDELLLVFNKHAIDQIVDAMQEYSSWAIPVIPLPSNAKPLAGGDVAGTSSVCYLESSPTTAPAMHHYQTVIEPNIQRTFEFLISRSRQDVIVVETIFGKTNTARQQFILQMMKNVVKPFLTEQLERLKSFELGKLEEESRHSPRSRRRIGAQIVDAITFTHTMRVRLFECYNGYLRKLRDMCSHREMDFLDEYTESLFGESRASHTELDLLQRHHAQLEEHYAQELKLGRGGLFDLHEAHMQKAKDLVNVFVELAIRTRSFALPKDVKERVVELVLASMKNMARFLDTELRKTADSLRGDRDNWRVKVKSEEEMMRRVNEESQQCGLRMLFFAQSTIISLDDAIVFVCEPLVQENPQLFATIDKVKMETFEALEKRAEALLNLCASAIIARSLSILLHNQSRHDYTPKVAKGCENDVATPTCTRACVLFCQYVKQQFEMAKEMIKLSRQTELHSRATAQPSVCEQFSVSTRPITASIYSWSQQHRQGASGGIISNALLPAGAQDIAASARARAQQMTMSQLLNGDGSPTSFVRGIGVCLYRGISIHLRSFPVSDRGVLIYKQDVMAYKDAMVPLISGTGLDGAVVEVLFNLLKETASLLMVPPDHIKGMWNTGFLRLLNSDEKTQIIKMRQDLPDGFRDGVK
ncbi:hypothetical protein TRVL_01768 [Trypanosoma vivax]|uniref:Exocyst complex component Sec10-like alpha-helical bundle domain-containing protein n=1 Tax=Trypanosoma vivax (strain Y486) TaxID=1055687 RepID=G0U0K0_TRYVY|nr:hypothetical protein TRVL_01768 [Trypanosoma vivax]CCC49599.1 conserved hypothetical protein [Trypanosoma vivax Y486]